MQMVVAPAKRTLEDGMQVGDRGVNASDAIAAMVTSPSSFARVMMSAAARLRAIGLFTSLGSRGIRARTRQGAEPLAVSARVTASPRRE